MADLKDTYTAIANYSSLISEAKKAQASIDQIVQAFSALGLAGTDALTEISEGTAQIQGQLGLFDTALAGGTEQLALFNEEAAGSSGTFGEVGAAAVKMAETVGAAATTMGAEINTALGGAFEDVFAPIGVEANTVFPEVAAAIQAGLVPLEELQLQTVAAGGYFSELGALASETSATIGRAFTEASSAARASAEGIQTAFVGALVTIRNEASGLGADLEAGFGVTEGAFTGLFDPLTEGAAVASGAISEVFISAIGEVEALTTSIEAAGLSLAQLATVAASLPAISAVGGGSNVKSATEDLLGLKTATSSASKEASGLTDSTTRAGRGVFGLTQAARGGDGALRGVAQSMSLANGAAGGLLVALTAVGIGLGAVGLRFDAQQEQIKTGLATITGSAKTAGDLLTNINKTAVFAGFDPNDLASGLRNLLDVGLKLKDTFTGAGASAKGLLITLASTVASTGGNANDLKQLVSTVADIQAKGTLTAQSLKALAAEGVPIDELQKVLGLTADQMKEIGKQGVSANTTIVALKDVLDAKFGSTLQAQSDNLTIILRGLKTEIEEGLGGAVAGIANGIKPGLEALRSGLADFEESVSKIGLTQTLQNQAPALLEIFDAIRTAISGVVQYVQAAEPAIEGFAKALAAIGTVAIVAPLTAVGEVLKIVADALRAIGSTTAGRDLLEAVGVATAVAFAFSRLNTVLAASRIALSVLGSLIPPIGAALSSLGEAISGTEAGATLATGLGLVSKSQAAVATTSAAAQASIDGLEGSLAAVATTAGVSGETLGAVGVAQQTLASGTLRSSADLQVLADVLGEAAAAAGEGTAEYAALSAAQQAVADAAVEAAAAEKALAVSTEESAGASKGFLASILAIDPALLAVAAAAGALFAVYKLSSDAADSAAKANLSLGEGADIVGNALDKAGDKASSFQAAANEAGKSLKGISDSAAETADKTDNAFAPLINQLKSLNTEAQKTKLIQIGVDLSSQGFDPKAVISQLQQLESLAGIHIKLDAGDISGFTAGIKSAKEQATSFATELNKLGDSAFPDAKLRDNLEGLGNAVSKDLNAGNFKAGIGQLAAFEQQFTKTALSLGVSKGSIQESMAVVTTTVETGLEKLNGGQGFGFSLKNTTDLASLLLQLGNSTTDKVNPAVKEFAKSLTSQATEAEKTGNSTKLYEAIVKQLGDTDLTTAQKEKIKTAATDAATTSTKANAAAVKDLQNQEKELSSAFSAYGSAATALSSTLDDVTDSQKDVATSAALNAGLGKDAWAQFATDSTSSLTDFEKHLEATVKAQGDYQANLTQIAAKFGPQVAEQLAALGPQAAGLVANIVGDTTGMAQKIFFLLAASAQQTSGEVAKQWNVIQALSVQGSQATIQAVAAAAGTSVTTARQAIAQVGSEQQKEWLATSTVAQDVGKDAAAKFAAGLSSGSAASKIAMAQILAAIQAGLSGAALTAQIKFAIDQASFNAVRAQISSLGGQAAVTPTGAGAHIKGGGNVTAHGGIFDGRSNKTFATGGFNNAVSTLEVMAQGGYGSLPSSATIMPPQGPKGIFQWAEDSTEGEAFIPLTHNAAQLPRSIAIWQEVGRRLGQMAKGGINGLKKFASGGVTSFAAGGVAPIGVPLTPTTPDPYFTQINAAKNAANASTKAALDAAKKAADAAKAAADAATQEFFTELKNYQDYTTSLLPPKDQVNALQQQLQDQINQGHAWSSDAVAIRQKIDQLNAQIFGDAVKAAQNQHDFNFKNNENPQQQLADLNQQLADATAADGPWSDAATQIRQNIVDLTKQIADDAAQAAAQALSDLKSAGQNQLTIEQDMNKRLQQLSTDRQGIYTQEQTDLQSANDAYVNSIKSKTQSLLTSISATALPSSGAATPSLTSAQLLSNLQTQNTQFQQFNDALNAAKQQGISQTALDTLNIQGPQDLGNLKAALGLDPSTLNALVATRQSEAGRAATTLDTTDLATLNKAQLDAQNKMVTSLQSIDQAFGSDWTDLVAQLQQTRPEDQLANATTLTQVQQIVGNIQNGINALLSTATNGAPSVAPIPQYPFGGPVQAPANGTLIIAHAGEHVLTSGQAAATQKILEAAAAQMSQGSSTAGGSSITLPISLELDGKVIYQNQKTYQVRDERNQKARFGKVTAGVN